MIEICARNSALSKAQVKEVLDAIRIHFPHLSFNAFFLETTGDIDLKTSLKDLDKTDFFTREIDQALLKGECRIAIHSAKDLPEPIPKELEIVAITKGVETFDSLVMRDNESLKSLSQNAIIGTSTKRREKAVLKLNSNFQIKDLRGKIEERLSKLYQRKYDAIVLAEAAIVRLNLYHLNRIQLEGEVAPLQGKLAVVARKDDKEIKEIFSKIDERR